MNRLDSLIRRLSTENDAEFVARLYVRFLHRPPETEALESARARLCKGEISRAGLRREILASEEYRSSISRWKRCRNLLASVVERVVSGERDAAFVERLYGEMLCRPADPGALAAAAGKLRLGAIRRVHLRREIAGSPEYRDAAAVRERREWLRRAPVPKTARSLATAPPEEVWLELTTRCNIRPACSMCGYAGGLFAAPRRDMDPSTWRALLPLLRGARHVGLHGAGEPLLYPHLDRLLGALRSSPAVVGFNSNGHLLAESVSRRLVERRLGWISVSVDAATAGTYLRIRRRGDFDALLGKVRRLREIRDAAGAVSPRIELNMTLMRLNLPEVPAFIGLAAELGADGVMFQEIQPGGSHRVTAPDGWVFDYREQELVGDGRRDEVLAEASGRAAARGLGFNCEILYGPVGPPAPAGEAPTSTGADCSATPRCAEPWKRLLFDVEGGAYVCCSQKTNGILLGRAPEETHERIWNGRRARLVREAMFGGAWPSACSGCFRTA